MSHYIATPKAFTTTGGAVTLGATPTNGPAMNVIIHGIVLLPAAAACAVSVTDSASAVVLGASALANGVSVDHLLSTPLTCKGPVTVTPSGTGASGVIYYSLA